MPTQWSWEWNKTCETTGVVLHHHPKMSSQLLYRPAHAYLFTLLQLFYCCQRCRWIAAHHALSSAPTTTTTSPTCGLCSPRASWVICIDHSLRSHLLSVLYRESDELQSLDAKINLMSVSYSQSTFYSYRRVLWGLHGLFMSSFNVSFGQQYVEAYSPPGFCPQHWLTANRLQLLAEHMGFLTPLDSNLALVFK